MDLSKADEMGTGTPPIIKSMIKSHYSLGPNGFCYSSAGLFLIDVLAMLILKLQGGDATALIGGTALRHECKEPGEALDTRTITGFISISLNQDYGI